MFVFNIIIFYGLSLIFSPFGISKRYE